MQQVEAFINGQRDYLKIKGDSGPLVYPAGHLYLFTALYYLVDYGSSISTAQYYFIGILLLNILVLHQLYSKSTRVASFVMLAFLMSKRIHSIFLLRMFNDVLAMLFVYVAILLLLKGRYGLSSIFYRLILFK